MNWQRDKVLIITSTLCLILAGVATFFVLKFSGRFSDARDSYDSTWGSIKRLAGEGIEPNRENFEVLQKNLEEVTKFKEEKIAWLRERQFESIDLQPIDFTSEVSRRVDGWEALTKEMKGVEDTGAVTNAAPTASANPDDVRPQDLWGGFEAYGREGRPPEASHVPRLTIQLQTVDMLCQLLLRAKVDELVSVTRETAFEKATSAPVRVDPDADENEEPPPPPLYDSESFTLVFRAAESTVWDVLVDLNETEHHVTVSKVLYRNENAELQPSFAEKRATTGGSARPSSRRPRPGAGAVRDPNKKADPFAPKAVSAGQEKVFATVELKVYRFPSPPSDGPEAGDENGDGADDATTPAKES